MVERPLEPRHVLDLLCIASVGWNWRKVRLSADCRSYQDTAQISACHCHCHHTWLFHRFFLNIACFLLLQVILAAHEKKSSSSECFFLRLKNKLLAAFRFFCLKDINGFKPRLQPLWSKTIFQNRLVFEMAIWSSVFHSFETNMMYMIRRVYPPLHTVKAVSYRRSW